jgi:hypothetical protein
MSGADCFSRVAKFCYVSSQKNLDRSWQHNTGPWRVGWARGSPCSDSWTSACCQSTWRQPIDIVNIKFFVRILTVVLLKWIIIFGKENFLFSECIISCHCKSSTVGAKYQKKSSGCNFFYSLGNCWKNENTKPKKGVLFFFFPLKEDSWWIQWHSLCFSADPPSSATQNYIILLS